MKTFKQFILEAPTNQDGSHVANFTPFLFPRDDDTLDQGFQGPAETGMDKWNRFFGVVPVTRMTLKTKLDGEDSIDDMVAASKEYTKVQDDLTDKERHDKIKRWAFGIRN